MAQANVFNAMNQSRNVLDDFWADRTSMQAGRAYADGDENGAVNALASGGMVGDAVELEERFARRDASQAEASREEQAARADFMLRGVEMLRQIPYEQRGQAFQQLRPALVQMLPPEVIQQLSGADMSDESLSAFATALGAEAEQLQLFNTPQGVVGVNRRSGESRVIHERPEQPRDAPQGYRWTEDDRLEPIPGGPADPAQAGRLSGARRAPAGGARAGSQSARGGAQPSRSSLPPGFTVRRR